MEGYIRGQTPELVSCFGPTHLRGWNCGQSSTGDQHEHYKGPRAFCSDFDLKFLCGDSALLLSDEEVGGQKGMEKFVEHPEFKKLNIGFALDEGEFFFPCSSCMTSKANLIACT